MCSSPLHLLFIPTPHESPSKVDYKGKKGDEEEEEGKGGGGERTIYQCPIQPSPVCVPKSNHTIGGREGELYIMDTLMGRKRA